MHVSVKMWSTLGAVCVWCVCLIGRTCVTFNPQLEKNELLFSSTPMRRTVGKLETLVLESGKTYAAGCIDCSSIKTYTCQLRGMQLVLILCIGEMIQLMLKGLSTIVV